MRQPRARAPSCKASARLAPTSPPPMIARLCMSGDLLTSGGHQRLDLGNALRHATGEDFAAGPGHHHIVLDAHADAAPLLADVLIVHGNINATQSGRASCRERVG